jgi:hypothetical protein
VYNDRNECAIKMKSRYHILTTLPFAMKNLVSPYLFVPLFIGAVLVDFDHCIDFYLRFRRTTFSITELSESLANKPYFILPLHSVEFILFTLILTILTGNDFIFSFTIGFMIHIILDIITNGYPSISSLSLIYRIINWGKDVCSNTD